MGDMTALGGPGGAQGPTSSQENKRNDPDWCSSLHHSSVPQSDKRLLGSSAIRLETHLDVSTPCDIRLSKIAHPRGAWVLNSLAPAFFRTEEN